MDADYADFQDINVFKRAFAIPKSPSPSPLPRSGGEGWGEGARRSGKMTVFVKTVGTLKSLEEETTFVPMDVPLQTSVSQIIERLKLNDWEVGFILVNGARGTTESILQEGDQLTLIAPLVGG